MRKVENIVLKGLFLKGYYYEQFSLLPQCLQKLSAAEASETIYMLESVKELKLMTINLYYCSSQILKADG